MSLADSDVRRVLGYDADGDSPNASVSSDTAPSTSNPRPAAPSASGGSSGDGITIVSSGVPSSWRMVDENEAASSPSIVSSLLSLHPSLVDSSIVIPDSASIDGSCLTTASFGTSTTSAFGGSQATPTREPDTAPPRPEVSKRPPPDDTNEGMRRSSSGRSRSNNSVSWWDQLQSEDDWDNFCKRANEMMEAMIEEEMLGNEYDADKKTILCKARPSRPRNENWIGHLFKSFFGDKDRARSDDLVATLVKELVSLKLEVDSLPAPPSFPDVDIDNLPGESKEALLRYQNNVEAWQERQGKDLKLRLSLCKERLLAAIIDAEKDLFEEGRIGEVNGDGYFEVRHNIVGVAAPASQTLCPNITLTAALIAAVTAGASLFVHQLKRVK